ncbi:hypothetical protein J3F84DRAFT_363625 [Trichoderma pleuroticola]
MDLRIWRAEIRHSSIYMSCKKDVAAGNQGRTRVRGRWFFIVLFILSLLNGVLVVLFNILGDYCVQAHHKARIEWD